METEPLSSLILLARKKDPKAFGLLVNQTRNTAFQTALRIAGNREDAQDIIQEAYVRLWHAINRFNPDQPFNPWFRQIVRNLAIDCLRRKKRNNVPLNEEVNPREPENPTTILENYQLIETVRKWIPTLPRTQQTVFIMRDIENLSISEVQAESGLSAASIKTNLHLARKKLKTHLTHYGYQ
ncbi:MAG: sigma-70 family RNA polymerase sigma factor [Bacteroidales bacterium]